MTPSVRRRYGTARGRIFSSTKPLTVRLPLVGLSSAVRSLIMVDLPDPEGPTRNTNSPSSIFMDTPLSARVPIS